MHLMASIYIRSMNFLDKKRAGHKNNVMLFKIVSDNINVADIDN